MKKHIAVLTILFLFVAFVSEAQYYPYSPYGRPRMRVRVRPSRPMMAPPRKITKKRSPFQSTVNISLGYGFPNLDKNQLAVFANSYSGTTTQHGPITGSVDYQFSPNMSIGVMGTYGKVSAPYYDYNSSGTVPSFTGSLENWSIMFNLMSYFPSYNHHVEPYIRTAVGINSWNQNYLDPGGNKVIELTDPSQFAYQASLGARFNLSKQAGLYLEAGYGKYILNGGLAFKFK